VHWTARYLTGVRIEDFGGQFKAYRREVIETTMHRWRPGVAFFPLTLWLGFPVAEVVVRHDPRKRGTSRYTLGALARMLLDLAAGLIGLRRTCMHRDRPDRGPGYVIARRPPGETVRVDAISMPDEVSARPATRTEALGTGAPT
jgi:hypothetical protein